MPHKRPLPGSIRPQSAERSLPRPALPDSDDEIIDGVLGEFLRMCAVPHGSGNEWIISRYFATRLGELGLSPTVDDAGNVICDVPAAPGLEDAPLIIFQGHVDMVCVALSGSGYQPKTDGIVAVVRDGELRSDGRSSLGADCNIGNAAVIYLIARRVSHGPLRLIFTVEEEHGLVGASKLDASVIQGADYLINVDGFKFGDIVTSSSGGRREIYTRRLTTSEPTKTAPFILELSGFLGGHSGYDINKDRGNANKLMGHFLHELKAELPFELSAFTGGSSHNAIPASCRAELLIDPENEALLIRRVDEFQSKLHEMFARTDEGCRVTLTPGQAPRSVWSGDCTDAALNLILLIFNGVYSMNNFVPDRVASSSNLGKICINDKSQIELAVFVRCAMDANEEFIAEQHITAAQLTGFRVSYNGYKGWPGSPDNPLAELMCRVYRRQTGGSLSITATHAGLETSIFHQMRPELTMVNVGMDVINPHSLDEHVNLSTVAPFVRLMSGALGALSSGEEP